MNRSEMTDKQKLLAKSLDSASESCLQYSSKTVPPLGNLTKEGLTEELGRLNESRKAMEKTEKIVRGRLEAMLGEETKCRGDNFEYNREEGIETTRLDQTKAKEVLGEIGRLEECMNTSESSRVTIKRI